MTDYATVRPLIQSGDILLFEGSSLFGLLIRWATRSPYAHVALARWDSGRLMCFQSMEGRGVEVVPLSTMLKGNTIHVLRVPSVIAPVEAFPNFWAPALDDLGGRYSWWSIVYIGWRILWGRFNIRADKHIEEHKGAWICSEYVGAVLKASGYVVPWDALGFIAPSDFGDDPNLATIAVIG